MKKVGDKVLRLETGGAYRSPSSCMPCWEDGRQWEVEIMGEVRDGEVAGYRGVMMDG